jgi:hypothetical protein
MNHDLWQPVPVPGLKLLLAGLRDEVLRRDPKRCPKWGFRLADDLAVQLQPRPLLAEWGGRHPQPLFLGAAACATDGAVPADVFKRPQAEFFGPAAGRGAGSRGWLQFQIIDGGPDWQLKARYWRGDFGREGFVALRQRLVDELPARLNVFDPQLMLRPACLCCGKALTDPASVARWVGPECASDGSLTVPGLDLAAGVWKHAAVQAGLSPDTPPEIVHDYMLENPVRR